MTNNRHTMYRLAQLMAASRSRPSARPSRIFQPGPATLRRFTIGMLIMETVKHVRNDFPTNYLAAEFHRRDLAEVAHMIETKDFDTPLTWNDIENDHALDRALARVEVPTPTDGLLNSAASVLDENMPDDPYRIKTMLSPAEQLDDLIAIDAGPEVLDSFARGIGTSTQSPSVNIAQALETDTKIDIDYKLVSEHNSEQSTGLGT